MGPYKLFLRKAGIIWLKEIGQYTSVIDTYPDNMRSYVCRSCFLRFQEVLKNCYSRAAYMYLCTYQTLIEIGFAATYFNDWVFTYIAVQELPTSTPYDLRISLFRSCLLYLHLCVQSPVLPLHEHPGRYHCDW
jgi:hypothetical protein